MNFFLTRPWSDLPPAERGNLMMNNPSRKKLHPAELNLQDFWALFTVSTKRPPPVSSCSHGLPLSARWPAALMFFSDRCVLEARL